MKTKNSIIGIKIRQEKECDCNEVAAVIKLAFAQMEESDHSEHLLVNRLRSSVAFIPELSLVAESDKAIVGYAESELFKGQKQIAESGKTIVGYALMTKVEIVSENTITPSLCLAPVAVLPHFQRLGIGSSLIRAAHDKALQLGFKSAVVLGHKDFYPRFGYKKAACYGIAFPFDVPDEFCMAVELCEGGLNGVQGMVKFPSPFME